MRRRGTFRDAQSSGRPEYPAHLGHVSACQGRSREAGGVSRPLIGRRHGLNNPNSGRPIAYKRGGIACDSTSGQTFKDHDWILDYAWANRGEPAAVPPMPGYSRWDLIDHAPIAYKVRSKGDEPLRDGTQRRSTRANRWSTAASPRGKPSSPKGLLSFPQVYGSFPWGESPLPQGDAELPPGLRQLPLGGKPSSPRGMLSFSRVYSEIPSGMRTFPRVYGAVSLCRVSRYFVTAGIECAAAAHSGTPSLPAAPNTRLILAMSRPVKGVAAKRAASADP